MYLLFPNQNQFSLICTENLDLCFLFILILFLTPFPGTVIFYCSFLLPGKTPNSRVNTLNFFYWLCIFSFKWNLANDLVHGFILALTSFLRSCHIRWFVFLTFESMKIYGKYFCIVGCTSAISCYSNTLFSSRPRSFPTAISCVFLFKTETNSFSLSGRK